MPVKAEAKEKGKIFKNLGRQVRKTYDIIEIWRA